MHILNGCITSQSTDGARIKQKREDPCFSEGLVSHLFGI